MHDLPVTTRVLWWVWCLIPLELAKHSVCFWLRLGAWMSKTSWPQSGAAVIKDPPHLINHSIRWEVVKSKTGFKTSGFDWKRVVFFAPYELCGFGWLGRGSTLIAKYYFGGEPPLIDQPGSISGVYKRYLFIRILCTYIFCNIVHIHIVLFLSIQRSTVGTETSRISCAVSSFTSVNASVHFSLECWLNTAQIISNPNVPWLHKTLYRGYNMIIHPMMGVLVISGNGHVNLMILWNINGLMTIHHPLEKWQFTPVLIMMIMAPWHI